MTLRARAISLLVALALPALAGAQSLTSRLTDDFQPTLSAVAGFADHRVDAGLGFERTRGPLFGLQLDAIPLEGTRLTLRALGGSLNATPGTPAEPRDVGEVSAMGRMRILDWLDARGGVTTRTFTGALARQRWTSASFGADLRTMLLDGRIEATAGLQLLPLVRVSGHPSPDIAIASSTGLRVLTRRWVLGLGYQLERYDFPRDGGTRRLEEHSMLMLRAGYRFGRKVSALD